MVHISDGILANEVWISGLILTGIILAYALSRIKIEEIPKLSLVTSALFVASLVHIPIGPTSVHLILAGLAGVLLGLGAFPSVFIAVLLQAFLFQHGGITTLGINTLNIGLPALVAHGIFRIGTKYTKGRYKYALFGTLGGGIAIVLALLSTSAVLYITGEDLWGVIVILMIAHLPVIVIESVLVGSIAAFLSRVKPEMIQGAIQ